MGAMRGELEVSWGPHLLDALPLAVAILSREGICLYANPALIRIWGYGDASEVVGQSLSLDDSPQGGDSESLFARVLAGESVEGVALRVQRREGSAVDLRLAMNPLKGAEGAIGGVLAVFTDVTDWKRSMESLRRSEERYRILYTKTPVMLHSIDGEGRIVNVSDHWLAKLGYEREEVIGRPASAFLTPESARYAREVAIPRLLKEGVCLSVPYQFVRKDGQIVDIELSAIAERDEEGAFVRSLAVLIDMTEAKKAAAENLRLATFLKESPYFVIACDAEGEIHYVNPASEATVRRLGLTAPAQLLPAHHRNLVRSAFAQEKSFRDVEVRVKDRVFSWYYHPVVSLGEVHLHGTDITDKKQAEEQLRRDALHDGLTGLPNRVLFMEWLTRTMAWAKRRSQYRFAVLFLDIDRFKMVNDSLGHPMGDRLLVTVGKRLRATLRPSDMVARLGGDEFGILVDDLRDEESVTRVAARLQEALARPIVLSGQEVVVTASIGVALSSLGYERPEDLLRDADLAMYRAKARGKARFEVFDAAMHREVVAQMQLENDLRRALERGEFRLYYQPLVHLRSGRIAGVEALLRWYHPVRRLIPPRNFIPLAEETGLILPLGEWVLRRACEQAREWEKAFPETAPLFVTVNISGLQFSQGNFPRQVASILEATGLNPRKLRLEITESVILREGAEALEKLRALREMGVGLDIDDFGTGYSSLAYLKQFPIQTLKVDRTFIRHLEADGENVEIVRAIVTLAHNLALEVTAEGVETAEQLNRLRFLRCDYGQGFYFAKPLKEDEATALITRGFHHVIRTVSSSGGGNQAVPPSTG